MKYNNNLSINNDYKNEYTLLIPTFNRNKLLTRLLNYLYFVDFNFKIFVLDSSSDITIKRLNKKICQSINLDIDYFEYRSDIHHLKKYLDGLSRVKTKYVSMCADDDIIFVDAIYESVKFLDNNKDYVACHGIYLSFSKIVKDKYKIGLEYLLGSIDQNTPEERLFYILLHYESPFYAVYRKCVYQEIIEKIISYKINSIMFGELFQALATIIHGKIKRLENIYYARSNEEQVATTKNWEPSKWFVENPIEMLTEYKSYRNNLITFLSNKFNINYNNEKLTRFLDIIHGLYFNKYLDISYVNRTLKKEFLKDIKIKIEEKIEKNKINFFKKITMTLKKFSKRKNKIRFILFKIKKEIIRKIIVYFKETFKYFIEVKIYPCIVFKKVRVDKTIYRISHEVFKNFKKKDIKHKLFYISKLIKYE